MANISVEARIEELSNTVEFYRNKYFEVVVEKTEMESKLYQERTKSTKLEQEVEQLKTQLRYQNEEIYQNLPVPEHIRLCNDWMEGGESPESSVRMDQQENESDLQITRTWSQNESYMEMTYDAENDDEEEENMPDLVPEQDPLEFTVPEQAASSVSPQRGRGRRQLDRFKVKVEKTIKKKKRGLLKYSDNKGRTRAAHCVIEIKLE